MLLVISDELGDDSLDARTLVIRNVDGNNPSTKLDVESELGGESGSFLKTPGKKRGNIPVHKKRTGMKMSANPNVRFLPCGKIGNIALRFVTYSVLFVTLSGLIHF